jgi:signal transduction histidine kinase/HAMP domain-containing protein
VQVKDKLRLTVFTSVLMAIVIVAILAISVYRVSHAAGELQICNQLISLTLERILYREDYLRNSSDRAKTQWLATHEQITDLLLSAKRKFRAAEVRKVLDALVETQESVGKLYAAILKNHEMILSGGQTALSRQIEDRLSTQLNVRIYTTVFYARHLQEVARDALNFTLKMAGGGIVFLLLIIIIAVTGITSAMRRTIINRIKMLKEGAAVIGNGNLDYRITLKGTDEFVDLSESFNAMTVKLRESYGNLETEIGERKRAQEILRESEERFRLLFESMNEVFELLEAVYDDSGEPVDFRLLEVNSALERTFKKTKDQLVGNLYSQLFPTVDPQQVAALKKTVRTGAPTHMVPTFSRVSSRYYDIHIWSPAKGKVAVLATDVTERLQAEQTLRESEDRGVFLLALNDVLRPLSDAIAIQETASRLLGEHLKADRTGYFEIEGDDCVIMRQYAPTVPELLGRFQVAAFGSRLMSMYQTGRMVVMNNIAEEPLTPQERQSYESINVQAQISMPLIKNGEFVAGLTVHSATPRVWTPHEKWLLEETAERTWAAIVRARAEEALRDSEEKLQKLNENLEIVVVRRTKQVNDLSKALTIAEQRERKKFSTILHENLQQVLLGARMQLNLHLQDHRRQNAATEEDFEVADSVRLLEKGIALTRSLSLELNPPVLNNQGLDAALSWLCNHMKENYGLNVELHNGENTGCIRDETQVMLVQMARELLHNVIKYSGVMEAKLETAYGDKTVHIVVIDRGSGFNVDEVLKKEGKEKGLGLFSIKERLRLFGGNLRIESAPRHGTKCTIQLPYDKC